MGRIAKEVDAEDGDAQGGCEGSDVIPRAWWSRAEVEEERCCGCLADVEPEGDGGVRDEDGADGRWLHTKRRRAPRGHSCHTHAGKVLAFPNTRKKSGDADAGALCKHRQGGAEVDGAARRAGGCQGPGGSLGGEGAVDR